MVETELISVYAPNSDEPLIPTDVSVEIKTKMLWVRDPEIYGRGSDNLFRPPSNNYIYLNLIDRHGGKYSVKLRADSITIDNNIIHPDDN